MRFLKTLLEKRNFEYFVTPTEEALGVSSFEELLKGASRSRNTNQAASMILLLSGTLELLRYCVMNRNLTATMSWLAQSKEIDEVTKVGVFSYLWMLKDFIGGDAMPTNKKAD